MLSRLRAAILLLVVLVGVPHAAAGEPEARWTAGDADALVDLSLRAAQRGGPDAVARLLIIAAVADDASAGKAATALEALAGSSSPVAADARWIARATAPEPAVEWRGLEGIDLDDGASPWPGLVRTFLVLGPFADTGGGLARREGPETDEHHYASADYSWGVYAVRPRRSLVASVRPRGVPLDLYIHPREESCTYLDAAVVVPSAGNIVVNVAASGTFRLQWDRQDVASDENVHGEMWLDRAAVRVAAGAGDHLLSLKVCTGARPDEGRARVRFADEAGRDLALATSSDPVRLDAVLDRLRAATPKVSAERLRTPLEAAIDAPPELALVAAVTRVLGGADDLRATRAPGLLDAVTGSPALSADQLALAGWVSPSDANSSGWLTQALERARREKDDETAAFAQRELVELRMRGGLVDLAKATADEAPFAAQHDASARLLRARVKESLGGSGLGVAALADLEAITQTEGSRTPLAVWRGIARLAGGRPATELAALQKLSELHAGYRGSDLIDAYAMMGGDTVERVALAHLLDQTRIDNVLRIGQMLLGAGRYEAARQTFTLATELGPNLPDGFEGLARALRALDPTAPQSPAVLDALTRASELTPGDPRLTAEMSFRKGEVTNEPVLGDDARWLVAPEVFLARAKQKPAGADVFSRLLHWKKVVALHPDQRVSEVIHYAREIGIEPRTEDERYESIPSSYGGELLLARVHRKDGTVVAPDEQDAYGPMVRWPKLARGDVVEIAVRSWTSGPVGRRGDMPYYFFEPVGGTDTNPTLFYEMVIIAPKATPLAFDVVGGAPDERNTSTEGDRTETHLVWNTPPTVRDEPLSPMLSELVPVVVGSLYPSWDVFLDWYEGAVEGFTTPDEQVKRLAEELTAGKTTREAKVDALFDFVADDIRYVNFTSGEWWLPNRPQELLARRQGDCDDKAMLLITLLRAVGIEAKEVLVQTRYTAQRRLLGMAGAAIPLFDHGIVFLPGEKGAPGRFLDATSPQSRLGVVPGMDSGAVVLLVEDKAHVIETPTSPAADHGVDGKWTIELDPQGGGKLTARERHTGDLGFRLRSNLAEPDTRAQYVEQNLVAGYFPSITVDPQIDYESELAGGAASVGYRATSRSIARREGNDLVVTIAPATPLTAQLAPLPERTLPVELPPYVAPQERRMTIEIVAPPSHVFAEPPPDGEANEPGLGRATVKLTLSADKRRATMVRDVALEAWRIPLADYPRWRRWLQHVDGLLLRSLRLVPR
jgi:transglutaminase-like putative cysteine protease/tetratricopeptide (TPR) repeat protein